MSLPSDTTTYNVTMVDSSGLCSNAGYVTVSIVNLDLATSSTDASCGPNGSASVTTTGGSGTYSYQWNDDANQTTATATGLAVGNYTVVVTDVATGCQDSAVATVNPTPASLVAYVSNTRGVSCYGSADGRLTVSVNGGTAPFDYVWDNGSSTLNTSSTSDSIVNLVGGTYEVTVTDNNGCTYTVSALVPEPDSLMSAIDSVMNPTCLGATDGYLRVFIDGGAAPHSILWDDPSASTTNEVFNLGVGTYCVTTTDANGCIDSACFTLTAPQLQSTVNDTICYNDNYTLPDGTIVSPSADTVSVDTIASSITGCDSIVTTNLVVNPLPTISINVSPNDTVCEGSSVTLTASGSLATGYTWTPTIQNGVAFTPAVGATQYIVSTTDVNTTCQNSDSITIVVNPLPSVVANASDIEICDGDSIYLFGTGTDIYTWDNGYQDSVYFAPAVGTHDYYVTGTDTSTGCTNRDTVTVTVNPTPNVTANTSDNNVCFGTQITLTGGGADTYSWNPTVQNGTAFTPSVGSTVYTVTGTDVNGCQDSASLTIVVNPLPTVVANAAPNDTICEINDVTLFGSGNADNYLWTNGVLDGNPFSQNVGTQDYIVTGTNTATNCQSADTISITVLSQPQVDVNITPNDTLCEGTAVTLTASGATTYIWDNNNVENGVAFIQNVGFTTYTVIGNTQGCEDTVSVSVLINPTPSIDATATPDSIYPGDQSILEAIGSGSFVWDGVQNGSTYTVSPLDETTYSVQITDANGCVNETTITVYVLGLTQDQLMIPDAFSPNNDNINDIFRVVTSQYFPEIEMRVYNRWGEMVHSEVGQTNHGWDGKFKGEDQPVDAYSYIVRVKTLDDQEFIVSGTVSLFR
ncbi:MAG: gliding motility-associated C-terminal domain-containing protein [Chitinophagales bacterium]